MSNPVRRDGEEYQSIFENALEGIFQTSLDGHFIKVNPALSRIYGYDSPEDMMKTVVDTSTQIHVDDGTRKLFVDLLTKQGIVEGFEARNYRKDGSIIWTRTNARAVRDENGNILYFEGFLTDITSLKEAEFALRESEAKYRALVEHLPGAVFLDAPDDSEKTIFVSPRIEEILGYSPKEWETEVYWSDVIHPEDRERVLAENKRTDETGEVFLQEYRVRKKDDEYVWIREESSLIKDNQGKPLFWQGFFVDISDQKRAERVIHQSEKQFKTIFQANPIASCIATLEEGRYIAANDAYWKLSGFKPGEFLGLTSRELHFVNEQKRRKFVNRLKKEKFIHNEDGELLTKRGEIRRTLEFFDLIVFEGQECILGMFYDITDRVTAQEKLRESEEKYRQLFEAESDAIFLIEIESGNILDINEAAEALYGYSKNALLRMKNSDLLTEPEDNHKAFQDIPLNHEQVVSIPLQYHKKKNGTIFPVEITGRFFEWRGKAVHIAAVRDITQRKKVEEALITSEERFRLAFQTSPDSMSINRMKDGLFVDANEGFTIITGYSREEVVGKTSEEIDIWKNQDERAKFRNDLIQNGVINNQEAKFRTKDGHLITGLISARIITLDNALHIISIIRNIESIKQTEDTLQRQLKELSILHNIAVAASSSKSVDELIQRATDTVNDILQPDICGVGLVINGGDKFQAHPSYRGASKSEIKKTLSLTNGVVGKVISTGKAILLEDVTKVSTYIEITQGIKSELCVPIKIQDRVIGAFNIESKKASAYTESDERLLNTIAGTMATAIEQLRLFETSQRRLQELTILNTVGQASTEATSVDDLLEKVTRIIGESIYPDNFGILLLNEDGKSLKPHPSYRGITESEYPANIALDQGVSGKVAASGQPLRIANVRNFKKYIEVTPQVRSELCVPIAHGNNIFGVINAESLKIDAFSEGDEQLLTTIASTLATAIEKLRLFKAEQQRREDAEALREATTTLTTSIKLDTLLNSILDSLKKIVSYDSASITLKKGDEMEIIAGRWHPDKPNFLGKRLPTDGKWKQLTENRQPLIIPDVTKDEIFIQWEGSDYIRCWMGVPLVAHDKFIGAINLDSQEVGVFTQKDASIVQTFANSAAVAIENARLFQAESQRSLIIEAMAKIANEFATAQEILPALNKITQRSLELLRASTVAIYLLQDDDKTIKVVTALGTHHEQLASHTLQIGTGITGSIIASGQPEIIDDMFKDSRRITVPGTPEDDAQRDTIMSAPLILRGKSIGAINAWRKRSNGLFNESELNFLVTIANQTSMLIESIRLFQETTRHAREAHAIAEVGRDISSTLQLDVVLERIAQYAKDLLRAETSAVYISYPEDSLLRAIAAIGHDSQEIKEDPLPLGSGILGNIALHKSGEIVNNTSEDNRAITVKGTKCNPNEHIMGAPVLSKDQLTGLLSVWRTGKGEEFKPFELDFLISLAQQAASAIQNARQFEAEQRHLQEAETLRETAEAITSSLDIRQVLNAILNNLSRVVQFDSAALFLLEGDTVRLTAGIGFPDHENVVNSVYPASNSLLQKVWESGQPLILEDAQNDPRYEKWAAADKIRGWMGVPLAARGMIIGCITIDSYTKGAYSEHDATLASTFAHQAAAAIENARLFERSEQQIRQLTVLRDIDSAISSSFDLRVTLDFLVSHAIQELNADAATILMYNPDLQAFSLFTQSGFQNKQNAPSSYVRIGEDLSGQVALRRKLVQIPDLSDSPEYKDSPLVKEEGFKSYFGIPLIGKGQVKGVLEIYARDEINPTNEWLSFLQTLAGQAAIAIDNVELFKNLHRSNLELTLAYDTTLAGWGKALELRDKETQGHTNRVVKLTVELARRMGVSGEDLTNIMRGTLLHDIGKMGIPDNILNKPEALNEEEWEIMRQHPQFAYDLIYPIPYLRSAVQIPYGHHERWDGSGYPQGLKEKEIPLAARIFAVVDIWDALLNDRVYRNAWPEEKVIEYLKSAAGIELDPEIVEKFLEMIQEDHYKNQAE